MKYYIGIDLGTTNSAICSYDGVNAPKIYKSPEQNDVTSSAIYINKRGNKSYGYRAYNQASHDKDNSASLFKRAIGTSARFDFKDSGISLSPEECSAEILKILYSYLPEEIRNDSETATVITVPAAFNQVKKQATLEAAKMAGIARAALMQEPVAAVMSVMRSNKNLSGVFVIYDLGGGTFDVSVAESVNGKVNLLAEDGKEMCGGRDWDRKIFDNIVRPWLEENFNLPDDFMADKNYAKLRSAAMFAIEQAKIELSLKNSQDSALIQADDLDCEDLDGEEIYLDVPLTCKVLNNLIDEMLDETIEITRAVMKKAGVTSSDVERLVFIGGPTNYNYLRDKVSSELAVQADTSVNAMTAVAEGASIFAESIDWDSEDHNRKALTSDINILKDLNFRYEARVTGDKARVVCHVSAAENLQIEITSDDTGWTLGRFDLTDGKIIELPLNSKQPENTFTVNIYDNLGRKIDIALNKIKITKTLAAVGAIPASHSISITALNKLGGAENLVYLIKKDEPLPKHGSVKFKAAQTLRASTDESLNFNLWEGEIETPYDDNRFIGVYKISSHDLAGSEVIMTGSEIICDYEISDSGVLSMSASVPSLGVDFKRKNFYYHDDAKLDLQNTAQIAKDGRKIIERIGLLENKIEDERLDKAKAKAERAAVINASDIKDAEEVQETYNELYEAKKILSQINKEHVKEINQLELDNCVRYFNNYVEEHAERSEINSFNNTVKTAKRYISDPSFKHYLNDLWSKIFVVLSRQDWFIIDQFKYDTRAPGDYYDLNLFNKLKQTGEEFIRQNNIDGLRAVMPELYKIRKNISDDNKQLIVNIIRA